MENHNNISELDVNQHTLYQQRIHQFWLQQIHEQQFSADLKSHNLPLARIKKIMKFDEDVRMISAEVLDLFARACDCFIQELTLRAWMCTEDQRRKTLTRSDIATAIQRTHIYDFLIDIVPREEAKPLTNKGKSDEQVITEIVAKTMPTTKSTTTSEPPTKSERATQPLLRQGSLLDTYPSSLFSADAATLLAYQQQYRLALLAQIQLQQQFQNLRNSGQTLSAQLMLPQTLTTQTLSRPITETGRLTPVQPVAALNINIRNESSSSQPTTTTATQQQPEPLETPPSPSPQSNTPSENK